MARVAVQVRRARGLRKAAPPVIGQGYALRAVGRGIGRDRRRPSTAAGPASRAVTPAARSRPPRAAASAGCQRRGVRAPARSAAPVGA